MVIVRLPKEFLGMNVGVFQVLVLIGFIMIGAHIFLTRRNKDEQGKWYLSKEVYSTLIIYTVLMVVGTIGSAWLNGVEWNKLTREINQEKEEFLVGTEGMLLRNVTDREVIEYMGELYETESDMVRLKKRKKETTKPIGKVFVEGSKQEIANLHDMYTEEDRENILKADYESLNVFTDVDLALKDSSINMNIYKLRGEQYDNVKREQKRLQEDLEDVRLKEVQEETFLGVSSSKGVLNRALWVLVGSVGLSYLFTLIAKITILGYSDEEDDNFGLPERDLTRKDLEEYVFWGSEDEEDEEKEELEGEGFYVDDGMIVFDEDHRVEKEGNKGEEITELGEVNFDIDEDEVLGSIEDLEGNNSDEEDLFEDEEM